MGIIKWNILRWAFEFLWNDFRVDEIHTDWGRESQSRWAAAAVNVLSPTGPTPIWQYHMPDVKITNFIDV